MNTPASTPAATSPSAPRAGTGLAYAIASFVHAHDPARLPAAVRERASLHALDAIGLALASHAQDYAAPALAGTGAAAGAGPCTVIGDGLSWAARDAALANGLLMHGLDYDDTHLASIVHPTAASLPAALAMAEALGRGWDEMLHAYALGAEVAIRLGASARGGFHHVGFHATGVVSHFASALVAGRLLGLPAERLCTAQGIAASTASGVQVFLEDGAWTKRLHPGWGAHAGITAAHLAAHGFKGPMRPYEGRFGLYETHLHGQAVDTAVLLDGLGEQWHLVDTAIKPYPVCHFIHGCLDAALELGVPPGGEAAIESVTCWLPGPTLPIVAEPEADKQRARTDYEAKFSAPFVIATALLKGRFGLAELTSEALADPAVRRLALRVHSRADPDSAFPRYFSGGVSVRLRDGRELARHVRVNSGAGDRALDAAAIGAKFVANAALRLGDAGARRAWDALRGGAGRPVRELLRTLRR
ncbi:MAG: MmgE/PrpD family protein [Rubrivivax sp.]|nr:MmgE/PrpD family protein [Rubrivivax sp.]